MYTPPAPSRSPSLAPARSRWGSSCRWSPRTGPLWAAAGALGIVVGAAGAGQGEFYWQRAEGGLEEASCLHCKLLRAGGLPAEHAPERRFEFGSGRDLRNFPPDRVADFRHMTLRLDIPDMNVPKLSAKAELRLAPIGAALSALTLHAEQMTIRGVTARLAEEGGRSAAVEVRFSTDDRLLRLVFSPPIDTGREATLSIDYELNDPPDGLFWTPEHPAWPGRPAQIHTQGQPESNRFWFPIHDFPNERLTTEIIATVPEGFLVSANGREAQPARTEGGRTTFHWLLDKDHPAYLVSMIVGKFDVVDVAPPGSRVPMPVYVPPGLGGRVNATYGRTPAMVDVFERRFDEPYPWDRYAQLVVWNFGAGGMENTSATTLFDTAVLTEKALQDADLDGLIAHELGHQWFGDLITCNSWAHIWLNEGFATYSEALWFEARDGYDRGYLWDMHANVRGVAGRDRLEPDAAAPTLARPPMVSPVYEHPFEPFRRTSNPYPKGASILHMLRVMLGDELFFRGLSAYVEKYKFSTVETSDFRRTMEDVSGRSLERFFAQWCDRAGTPRVKVKASWDAPAGQLRLVIEQTQLVSPEFPAFVFDLPIEIVSAPTGSGSAPMTERLVVPVDAARHERVITLASEPAQVVIDPDLSVLASLEAEMPGRWLAETLRRGRTLSSRLDASALLGVMSRPGAEAALLESLQDAQEHHSVRAASAAALGKLGAHTPLASALQGGIDDARARLGAIKALAEAGGPEAIGVLGARAGDASESDACRAAALEGLGRHASGPEHRDQARSVLEAALGSDSQHEQVRIGALKGLAKLDAPDTIELAIPLTQFGRLARLRPEAIAAVGALGHHDTDEAVRTLEPLAFDREERARRAAWEALVTLEDKRGLEILSRAVAAARIDDDRRRAQAAHHRLVTALAQDESAKGLRGELEALKGAVKRLERQNKDQTETK